METKYVFSSSMIPIGTRFDHFHVPWAARPFTYVYMLFSKSLYHKPQSHVFFCWLLRTGVNKVGAGKTGLGGFRCETWKKEDGTGLSYIGMGMETICR